MLKKAIILFPALCLISFAACQILYNTDVLQPEIPVIDGAYYTGTDVCIPCHGDIYGHYKKTVHSRLAFFESDQPGKGCEICHGPASIHVKEKGGTGNIISFLRLSPEVSSEICLGCHRKGSMMDWRANAHLLNGIACNECHKPHKETADKMLYPGDPEICFSCHQDKKARNLLPSHHPVQEKKMKCGDCHTSHGSENNSLNQPVLNDLCFECHAEYQGPFIYEHEPVFEDCSICHDPHGTIADNLLKQNDPFICLRCHKGHRKNPKTGSHPTVASFLTSCTQCHSQVHGSDLPSQLNGSSLTR